jgi:hypothetical protein
MDLEQLLRAAFALRAPKGNFEDRVMARVSAAPKPVARGGASRRILVGTVLAVAAAASMLAVQLIRVPAPEGAATTADAAVITEAAAPTGPAAGVAEPEPVLVKGPLPASTAVESPPDAGRAAAVEAPVAVKPFTVRMQPLRNEAREVDARAAIDLYYTALVAGLRAVPGLTLVELEAADTGASVPGEYRLSAFGNAAQSQKVMLGISEGAGDMPGGGAGARFVTQRIVDVVPTCSNASPNSAERASCNDPASVAAAMVDMLRTRIFPPDPSLNKYLQERLTDARLDPNQRLKALMDLTALKGMGKTAAAKLDDAAVRGATELATKSSDPLMRAQVWQALRGVRHAGLLQPLMSAARDDADGDVRLQAVATLATDFAEDEHARAALQSIAREDSRPLVRALAQRGLNGDAAWKDYVVASLKDTNRPIAERMEAFMYHMYQPSPGGGFLMSMDSRKILDDEVIKALGKALPQASSLPDVKRMTGQLVGDLAQVKSATADAVLAELLEPGSEPGLRRAVITQLARRSSESRVRSMLEKIRGGDADPQLRELAEQALSGKPLSGAAPGMMQLPPLPPR